MDWPGISFLGEPMESKKSVWAALGILAVAVFFVFAIKVTKKDGWNQESAEGVRHPAATFASDKRQQDSINEMIEITLRLGADTNEVNRVTKPHEMRKIADDVREAVKRILEIAKGAPEEPGTQLMAAIARVVPHLEGIIWRCRAFIEPSDWMHMTALFNLRSFAYNDYLYGPHIKALFNYLTYPTTRFTPFDDVSDLQDYLLKTVAPDLDDSFKRLEKLLTNPNLSQEKFQFDFDRTVLVGSRFGLKLIDDSKEDGEKYKHFIKPYFYTAAFLLERLLMTIYYSATLELDDFPELVNHVIMATTINTVKEKVSVKNKVGQVVSKLFRVGDPAKGITPEIIYMEMKKMPNLFTFRKDVQVQDLLNNAYRHGRSAAEYQLAAYACGITYHYTNGGNTPPKGKCMDQNLTKKGFRFIADGNSYLFDPNRMQQGFKRKYNAFKQRARAYKESEEQKFSSITSDVHGRTLKVNLRAFFDEKRSPRSFFPLTPNPKGFMLTGDASEAVPDMKNTVAWHYDHGKPIAFNDYTFNGFFKDPQPHDAMGLYQNMTLLMYTPSIAPFAAFIRIPSPVQFVTSLQDLISTND